MTYRSIHFMHIARRRRDVAQPRRLAAHAADRRRRHRPGRAREPRTTSWMRPTGCPTSRRATARRHFLYLSTVNPPRQHYVRYDLKTGKRELDVQPRLQGRHDRAARPRRLLRRVGRRRSTASATRADGRIGCLASDDNGTTWRDHAPQRASSTSLYAARRLPRRHGRRLHHRLVHAIARRSRRRVEGVLPAGSQHRTTTCGRSPTSPTSTSAGRPARRRGAASASCTRSKPSLVVMSGDFTQRARAGQYKRADGVHEAAAAAAARRAGQPRHPAVQRLSTRFFWPLHNYRKYVTQRPAAGLRGRGVARHRHQHRALVHVGRRRVLEGRAHQRRAVARHEAARVRPPAGAVQGRRHAPPVHPAAQGAPARHRPRRATRAATSSSSATSTCASPATCTWATAATCARTTRR